MSRYFYITLHWFFSDPLSCHQLSSYPTAMRYYGSYPCPRPALPIGNCKVINYIAHRVIVSMPRLLPSSSRISFDQFLSLCQTMEKVYSNMCVCLCVCLGVWQGFYSFNDADSDYNLWLSLWGNWIWFFIFSFLFCTSLIWNLSLALFIVWFRNYYFTIQRIIKYIKPQRDKKTVKSRVISGLIKRLYSRPAQFLFQFLCNPSVEKVNVNNTLCLYCSALKL